MVAQATKSHRRLQSGRRNSIHMATLLIPLAGWITFTPKRASPVTPSWEELIYITLSKDIRVFPRDGSGLGQDTEVVTALLCHKNKTPALAECCDVPCISPGTLCCCCPHPFPIRTTGTMVWVCSRRPRLSLLQKHIMVYSRDWTVMWIKACADKRQPSSTTVCHLFTASPPTPLTPHPPL